MQKYILSADGEPEPCDDLLAWAQFYEDADRRQLARDELPGDVLVSTVFLALDHAHRLEEHVPVLWETLVFGGEEDDYCERYYTRLEALAGHERIVHNLRYGRSPQAG